MIKTMTAVYCGEVLWTGDEAGIHEKHTRMVGRSLKRGGGRGRPGKWLITPLDFGF